MVVHCRSTPGIEFAGIDLYTWVERESGTERVKCLAQKHNTMSPARRPLARNARSAEERTNREATAPPTSGENNNYNNYCLLF